MEAVNAVLPPVCPMCGKPAPFVGGIRADICGSCMHNINYVSEPACLKCGKPVKNEEQNTAVTAADRSMYMIRHVRCMNILRMSRNQYTDLNIITSRNMQEYMRSRWRTDVAG